MPARTSSRGPVWTSSVSGLLRKKGKRFPLPPAAPPALPPKYSTWACSSGPSRAPVFAGSFSSVSWVGLSRPQLAAAPGPRRLGASAQEAQSGAARPHCEHVGLGCELLLRDDPGVEEAQRRYCRGSAVAWRSRSGPSRPRMRLGRKTSVSQLQDAHEPAETRDARYLRQGGRPPRVRLRQRAERASSEGDCPAPCATRPDRERCPFCPCLQLKNGERCLHMHPVRHHGPERRFVCSGTKQLRAVMALHQCDLFRGRRPADYLARSAEPITCSVGPLSCTCRLRVDRECRVQLTASGPRFVCKDIGSGRERLLRPRLRRRLPQTLDAEGGSHAHDDEPLQCDIQLRGCQPGHLLPEHPKTMWPVAEDIVRSPDVSAWRTALYDGLRSADGFHVPSVDGTTKIASPAARRGRPRPLAAHSRTT